MATLTRILNTALSAKQDIKSIAKYLSGSSSYADYDYSFKSYKSPDELQDYISECAKLLHETLKEIIELTNQILPEANADTLTNNYHEALKLESEYINKLIPKINQATTDNK